MWLCGSLFLFWFKHDMRLRLRSFISIVATESGKRKTLTETENIGESGLKNGLAILWDALFDTFLLFVPLEYWTANVYLPRGMYWKPIYAHDFMFFDNSNSNNVDDFLMCNVYKCVFMVQLCSRRVFLYSHVMVVCVFNVHMTNNSCSFNCTFVFAEYEAHRDQTSTRRGEKRTK